MIEPNINKVELFTKYKSSYMGAFKDLSLHTFMLLSSFYMLWYFKNSYFSLITIPFQGLLLVRTFIVFHDCQHGSYTPNKILNYVISHLSGIFVSTSPNWILDHKIHHLTTGNIENNYNYKFNEIVYYSVNDYQKFTHFDKKVFVFFHTPIVYFGVIPFLYFFIIQRFIYLTKKLKYGDKMKGTLSIIIINHFVNFVGTMILYFICYQYEVLLHYFCSYYITSVCGFLLFFNQHTFNPAYLVGNKEWTQQKSGLEGSSFIQIPHLLKYFTMGIEYHHIHHMNSKIPGYNIAKYHNDVVTHSNLFDHIIKLNMYDCFNNLWLVLYDDKEKKYITAQQANKIINKNI